MVEVKACIGDGTPIDRVDGAKEARLRAIAHHVGATGVLLAEVRLTAGGALVSWSPC